MQNELIIEIPYGGLGDNLFHSHIPRIAKESGKYDKVFISKHSLERHPDNTALVWKLNPYVDGFSEEHGIKINIQQIVSKVENSHEINLMDQIMLDFGLDNNVRFNSPEIYYQPNYIKNHNKSIFDPNFLSWIGNVTKEDFMSFLSRKGIKFDAVMKQRSEKFMYIPSSSTCFIETKTLFDFCDLLFSANKIYCLTSGTATLATGLKKRITAFYGGGQSPVYRHSKNNDYIEIPSYFGNKVKRLVKKARLFMGL